MFQNDASVFTMKTRSKTLPQINGIIVIFVDKRLSRKIENLSALKVVNASNTF